MLRFRADHALPENKIRACRTDTFWY